MPYATIWIEGEEALDAYCMRRFGERPHFVETIGRCGAATIYMVYKQCPDGFYRDFYLMFMEHPNGDVNDIMSVHGESYEDIMKKKNTIKKDDKWIRKHLSST
jgi:hypothetical protein